MSEIRLHKYLAECGIGSRRKSEEYITKGLIKVNGTKISNLGEKINPLKDKVTFLNNPVQPEKKKYIILNKPKDYITTKDDPNNRKTIYDLLPKEYLGLYPVGRLDRLSTGLLLLTNDGDLTNKIIHPKSKITKIYRVTLDKPITKEAYSSFEKGVLLEGKMTLPAKCFFLDSTGKLLEIHLNEGRNRQIRKMFEVLGFEVTRLKRIAIGNLKLGKLKLGAFRELSAYELKNLKIFTNKKYEK
jgi:23S rRNA pseudouridine2605 synthase